MQEKRMNATCKNQKCVENKTRYRTPLADVTTYFVNQDTLHMESQLQCSDVRFRNVERNVTTRRKKPQSLLEKFEITVNNVTNISHSNIATQSFVLEDVHELQSDSDNSESLGEAIEGNFILVMKLIVISFTKKLLSFTIITDMFIIIN